MKKSICLILALALMLALAACERAPDPASATADTQPTTEPTVTDPPITEPPITEPPVTEPPVTEPPITEPPDIEPPEAHEKFDAAKCAPLLGTWSTTITLDGQLQNFELFTGRTTFELYYSFDEFGYFRAYADQTEFDNAIDDYEAMVIDHMVELRYITFKGPLEYQGVPEEEIQAQWFNGPELDARVECEEAVAALNLYHRFGKLLREGQYYVDSGKLYTQLSDGTFESSTYVPEATALSLMSSSNLPLYRDICINFPLIFWICK